MVWVTTEVDVDLEMFDDDDIREEYNNRNLGGEAGWDDNTMLNKIWIADREGRKDEAYTLMREYVLEKLNKVV
jgi:hypothetical protein